jgi:nucleoside-diphosphate-sugar epimerase
VAKDRVLVTGSSGLIGLPLCAELARLNLDVVPFDIAASSRADILDAQALVEAVRGCVGIVHLAAVSRVAHGERDPAHCRAVNAEGTRNVIKAAREATSSPWLVFASSREVYGQPDAMPVSEDAPLRPFNTYGRAKAESETLVIDASRATLRAIALRLTNVYGGLNDHPDRVIPAFVRNALSGSPLLIESPSATFDFVHVSDCVRGFVRAVSLLRGGAQSLDPCNLACGRATTLGDLARLVVSRTQSSSVIEERAALNYNVSRFVGDTVRAEKLLGWRHEITLEAGLDRYIALVRGAR